MTVVSVPGKLILMGEHAVVYGRPALVAAIALRLRVAVEDLPGDGVHLRLPGLGLDRALPWDEVRRYAEASRRRWEAFAARPSRATFGALRGADPAHLALVALGEASRSRGSQRERGLRLTIESEIPIGSGFGSSAAAAVGIAAAYLEHRGADASPEAVSRVALEVERRQHGLPSGVDHATVLAGGVVWARRDEEGAIRAEELRLPGTALSRLQVFDTGEPAEPTGDVVAAVRARFDDDPAGTTAILDRMERGTAALRRELERPDEDADALRSILRGFQRCLEELGVVPEPVRALVRAVEAAGGAAKICGAGALTGSGAGALLVHGVPAARVGATPRRTALGAPGLRREVAA